MDKELTTTLRREISKALDQNGEEWNDLIDIRWPNGFIGDLDAEFVPGTGKSAPVRVWSNDFVYFSVDVGEAKGRVEWIASVARHPDVEVEPTRIGRID